MSFSERCERDDLFLFKIDAKEVYLEGVHRSGSNWFELVHLDQFEPVFFCSESCNCD